jgi:ComF family protein
MGVRIRQIGVRLLDLLLPPLCLGCRVPVAQADGLCAACWGAIHFLGDPCCERCGHPFPDSRDGGLLCGACLREPPPFDRARAAFRYDGRSKGLVLSFKHADRPGLARAFAPWMARAGKELLADADWLVPVPLHRWRLFHRRYNQAALLAQSLSRQAPPIYRPDVLRRLRHTPPQGSLSRTERQSNVKGAIRLAVPPEQVAGRRIILVDDVLTTGATIGACAEILRRAGAARVDVVTLARVVLAP